MKSPIETTALDWLGLPARFHRPAAAATAAYAAHGDPIGEPLSPVTHEPAREPTVARLGWTDGTLSVHVVCHTAAMDRVRRLAREGDYARDRWGDDAIEIQLDPGLTRERYFQIILPPTGKPVTYRGFNNRLEQGWHPAARFDVALRDDRWEIEFAIDVAQLSAEARPGDAWGFNLLRVNPDEPTGYAQWAPTLGDALRPELFGTLTFAKGPRAPAGNADRLAGYRELAERRVSYFEKAIHAVDDAAVRKSLRLADDSGDWSAWESRLAEPRPEPLRWDAWRFGAEGIPACDRPIVLSRAHEAIERLAADAKKAGGEDWVIEALADAYTLTGERRYVDALERAIAGFDEQTRERLARVDARHAAMVFSESGPYHDYQVVAAALMAGAYVTVRREKLRPETHATVLRAALRAGRFAEFAITKAHAFGNHQVYESGGLALLALLFPEFEESDRWAAVASRSIAYHLERELYDDGGYLERCGYHSIALNFAMQAVTAIRLNHAESRFPELMALATLARLEKMHEWAAAMAPPEGTMPAFGDFRPYSQVRLLRRGAAFFDRPAWCAGDAAATPDLAASGFTVLRAGPADARHYLAVDHGPLGGQHSHCDNMGFIAYAFGEPIALDSGLPSGGYGDALYVNWSRHIHAHNVIAIDGLEPEKVSHRRYLHRGEHASVLAMRSDGYRHALGVTHDRTVFFCHDGLWLVCDRLTGVTDRHRCEWILHTPAEVGVVEPGVLRGRTKGGVSLTLLAAHADQLELAPIECRQSALPVPEAAELRLQDAVAVMKERFDGEIPMVTWARRPAPGPARFAVALLAIRGEPAEAAITPVPVRRAGRACSTEGAEAFEVRTGDRRWLFALSHDETAGLEVGGLTFEGVAGVAELRDGRAVWLETVTTSRGAS